ncbi:ATP-binding protein [Sphingomonas sp. HDW15A]|uniref:Gar/GrdA family gentamicin resistance ATP-binding protein n=1 Tax=Sphingomonas sp. HDW15A TaxID=2714942 RepID=UPI00140AF810|nr:Gar/GrdA family gentamicin resistance ATP-binding protein [Sphingomonas sp. HDW15A]QIK95159.1 ATP-binding protein [Sphingomonas sp. HDW15A]
MSLPLVILLNGPLGIGKSTLGEALGEAIERSVTLDGDSLAALNPPPADEITELHETLALLVAYHLRSGYDRFIINHYWRSAGELEDLSLRIRAIAPGASVRAFRLTLPHEANLRRIAQRQAARAIDESEFEATTFGEEFALLFGAGSDLGEPFDVSDPPERLVGRLLRLLRSELAANRN